MLTVTPDYGATVLKFYHPSLTTSVYVASLIMGRNCGSNSSPVSVLSLVPSIVNNTFEVPLATLFPTDTPVRFPDGVYFFQLTFNYLSGSNIVSTVATTCMLVDYVLKCTLDTTDLDILKKYKALQYASECDSCSCAKLCTYYNYLTDTITTDDTDCGCGQT